ncbi:MAG: phosphohydrolase [Acidiferrobacterales bacterium]|nr:phosphohydrolase [Acidiferrobacterales bacterium]
MEETNQTVKFTQMKEGSFDDYQLLHGLERDFSKKTADRVLEHLLALDNSFSGYKVSRLEHALQSATRAWRDNAGEEMTVAALLHDIGDILAPENHSEMAAALLRPYVSEKTYWILKHHGVFQGYYFFHHLGEDRNARDLYKDHEHYQACADFCENWDQNSFDPDYDSLPLEFFEPMVRRIFDRVPFGEHAG